MGKKKSKVAGGIIISLLLIATLLGLWITETAPTPGAVSQIGLERVVYPQRGAIWCKQKSLEEIKKAPFSWSKPIGFANTVCGSGTGQGSATTLTCSIEQTQGGPAVQVDRDIAKGGRSLRPNACEFQWGNNKFSLSYMVGNDKYFVGNPPVADFTLGTSINSRVICKDPLDVLGNWYEAPYTLRGVNNGEIKVLHIVKYDGAGVPVGELNTEGCVMNQMIKNILDDKEPSASDKGSFDQAVDTIQNLFGGETQSLFTQEKYSQVTVMREGDSVAYLDRYIWLPSFGNINPSGTYQGKNVITSPTFGIIEVEKITLNDGSSEWLPIQSLGKPQNFCTTTTECSLELGPNYACIEYQCQEGEGFCRGDWECPQPKYVEFGGTFQKTTYSCIGSACKPETKSVACTPSSCSQFGQWCDEQKGCQETVVSVCGNGIVDAGETCGTCYIDVQQTTGECCGNEMQEGPENCKTCPQDLPEKLCEDVKPDCEENEVLDWDEKESKWMCRSITGLDLNMLAFIVIAVLMAVVVIIAVVWYYKQPSRPKRMRRRR